jgi:hypothetical protein
MRSLVVLFALAAAAPHYVPMTPDAVRQQVKVYPRRNYAAMGFNDSAITIRLPQNDNSIYATFDFGKPAVVDKNGRPVPFQIEQGIYDFDTWSNEIRIQSPEGSKGPLAFARASGTIDVKYPLAVKTTTVSKGKPLPNVRIDGPRVIITGNLPLPEPATFSKIQPLRAYDAKGRELERGDQSTKLVGDHAVKTIAFKGDVAELQIDRIDQWVNLAVTYDLPQIAPLPGMAQGLMPPLEQRLRVPDVPGAVVKVTVR